MITLSLDLTKTVKRLSTTVPTSVTGKQTVSSSPIMRAPRTATSLMTLVKMEAVHGFRAGLVVLREHVSSECGYVLRCYAKIEPSFPAY